MYFRGGQIIIVRSARRFCLSTTDVSPSGKIFSTCAVKQQQKNQNLQMSPEKYKNKSSQENDDQGIKPIYTPASKLPTTKEGIRKPWNYFSPWQFWPSEPFQCGLCTRVHQRPAVRIFICNKHLSRNINNKRYHWFTLTAQGVPGLSVPRLHISSHFLTFGKLK